MLEPLKETALNTMRFGYKIHANSLQPRLFVNTIS